jgi:hypothetical protein
MYARYYNKTGYFIRTWGPLPYDIISDTFNTKKQPHTLHHKKQQPHTPIHYTNVVLLIPSLQVHNYRNLIEINDCWFHNYNYWLLYIFDLFIFIHWWLCFCNYALVSLVWVTQHWCSVWVYGVVVFCGVVYGVVFYFQKLIFFL